ncbi:hypothetical protein K437DRAFT_276055 [Tilletiaria anomala UBC 951]|uniref:sn-1-specific diacylglycerol lipase n=1 Tax=Tilletiaria anomala (strain ATCC 24038 / CBS 436.72 / UBC 951) TaxID=1037660 RepID=A0A066VL94_TILAU|nr:uncharacterized protein K437DRAFT_276055 [Tilletiaria anomala UBC 951]KDN39325.1 hypothetical protein K437DRAFT_276055 [Tilletiaria anomala UBC 951]
MSSISELDLALSPLSLPPTSHPSHQTQWSQNLSSDKLDVPLLDEAITPLTLTALPEPSEDHLELSVKENDAGSPQNQSRAKDSTSLLITMPQASALTKKSSTNIPFSISPPSQGLSPPAFAPVRAIKRDPSIDRHHSTHSSLGSGTIPAGGVRFITTSAILSRTGALYPLHGHGDDPSVTPTTRGSIEPFQMNQDRRKCAAESEQEGPHNVIFASADSSNEDLSEGSGAPPPPPLFLKQNPSRRGPTACQKPVSNGSALEAFSALLLGTDASGRVSSLSSARRPSSAFGDDDAISAPPPNGLISIIYSAAKALITGGAKSDEEGYWPTEKFAGNWGEQLTWLHARGAKAFRPKLNMPGKQGSATDANAAGGDKTIASRKERRWFTNTLRESLMPFADPQRECEEKDEEGNAFVRVGTKRSLPSFQMSRSPSKQPGEPQTDLSGPKSYLFRGDADPFSLDVGSTPPATAFPAHGLRRSPGETLNLRATSPGSKAPRVFGPGSAFPASESNPLPDAPPSPVGMPGAWLGGYAWRARPGDGYEEGALLLPPPLLDDASNDPRAFEGILGIHRARELDAKRKQLDRLRARNRPAHKVGMLTALTNFVRAAHAADKAAKQAARATGRPHSPFMFRRRHTYPEKLEPADFADEDLANGAPTSLVAAPFATTPMQNAPGSILEDDIFATRSSPVLRERGGSAGMSRKASLTIPEMPLDIVYEQQPLEAGRMSNMERRRQSSSVDLQHEFIDALRNPLPCPQSPIVRATSRESTRSTRSARDIPKAPKLIPVQLSSPGSPFSPFLLQDDLPPKSQLNAFSRPGTMPPTPQLGPTHLSLPPSPWVRDALSPLKGYPKLQLHLAMTSSRFASPWSPRLVPTALEVVEDHSPTPSKRKKQHNARMTPTALLADATPSYTSIQHERMPDSRRVVSITHRKNPNCRMNSHMSEDASEIVARPPGYGRSFLLWFFIGDLGLGTWTSFAARALHPQHTPPATAQVGIILGIIGYAFGFVVFITAHFIDLAMQIWEQACLALWFLHWTALNLTGRTVLSRCIIEAYHLIVREWSLVVLEDHEMLVEPVHAAARTWLSKIGRRQRRGLTQWQVLRSLFELYCIHDVTRERYHREGAGLEKLDGWRREHGVAEADSSDDEGSEEEMIVTNQDDDILQFTKTPRVRPRRTTSRENFGYFPETRRSNPRDCRLSRDRGLWEDGPCDIIKSVKWASTMAISAYGLHVHIVDLPETFTPSGERFSRQTFAYLSRLNPDDVLHADIQTLDSEAAYSPTFYVIKDQIRKVVIVAIRGTQSFQDIIVDLDIQLEDVELPPLQDKNAPHEMKCHAGVWRAAQRLVRKDSKLLSTLNQALAEENEYGLVLTGHSLGGAIASAVALLIGQYTVRDNEAHNGGRWVIKPDCGLPVGRKIRAITFAHPATASASLSERAAMGRIPLVLSVVLGADIIPRCGHGQARELRRVLGALCRLRRRHELATEGSDDARVHVTKSWWDWKAIQRTKEPDAVMLDRKERIERQMWRLRCDVEADLYAAVKQRAATVASKQSTVPPSPWIGPQQRASAPLHQLAARRQALDSATIKSEAASGGVLVPAGKSIWISGKDIYSITSPLAFFSMPDLHPKMFAEHFPSAYESALLEDIVC